MSAAFDFADAYSPAFRALQSCKTVCRSVPVMQLPAIPTITFDRLVPVVLHCLSPIHVNTFNARNQNALNVAFIYDNIFHTPVFGVENDFPVPMIQPL